MAYFRDDCYVFQSAEHFHVWVRGGHDGWSDTGWGQASRTPERDSGVAVPIETMDRFVLMRLVEMIVERTATSTLDSMADEFSRPGNSGENCIRANWVAIRRALHDLEDRCVQPRIDHG